MHGTFNEAETTEDAELQAAIDALIAPDTPCKRSNPPIPAGAIHAVYSDAEIVAKVAARHDGISIVARHNVPGLNELGLDGISKFPIMGADVVARIQPQRWDVGIWAPWHWLPVGDRLFHAETFEQPNGFKFTVQGFTCLVPGYGPLWIVSRQRDKAGAPVEFLSYREIPVLFVDASAAQELAQLVHPQPVDRKSGLSWVAL